MYALVRFLEGHDPHMRHVIGVSDIQDFRPADTSDFDNKSIYDAFWREGVEDNYSAQVLALGNPKEVVKDLPKRVPVPKMAIEESSNDETVVQKRRQVPYTLSKPWHNSKEIHNGSVIYFHILSYAFNQDTGSKEEHKPICCQEKKL
ncbi:unnamed protein product, partial [Ixodes pacificus]